MNTPRYDRKALGRLLMEDHGCIHHQGPNPFLNPCRACMRRVDLVIAWLSNTEGDQA